MKAGYFGTIVAAVALFIGSTHCAADFYPLYGGDTGLPDVGNWSFAAWGDYDNDGFLDLFLSGLDYDSLPEPVTVTKLYHNNSGNGTFADSGVVFPGLTMGSVAWGDYDNDGYLDLALQGWTHSCVAVSRIYRNNGNGTFTNINAGLAQYCEGDVAWGDYNNDGRLDLLLTGTDHHSPGTTAKVYRNAGNGTFADIGAPLPGITLASSAWTDYNNDGSLDLSITGWTLSPPYSNVSILYRGYGNGAFANVTAGLTGIRFGSIAWGDCDSDGYLDLLMLGETYQPPSPTQYLGISYHNSGNGTFANIGAGLPGLSLSSCAWGDYNSDGLLDALVAGSNGGGSCISRIYENDGFGGFVDAHAGLVGTQSGTAIWGDYNNDGMLDILTCGNVSSEQVRTVLYENIGDPAVDDVNSWVNRRPAAPTLATQHGAQFTGTVTLQWNAVTDDETPPAAMTYNLRVGTSPGACDVVSADMDNSHPSHHELLGNVQNGTYAKLRNLPQGTYYWAVQAVDGGYRRSEWSREGKFVRTNVISKPTPIPSAIAGGVVSR